MNAIERRRPRAGWRLAATLAVVVLCGVSVRAISLIQGPVEGPLAVRQLEDNPVDYSLGRAVAVANLPGWIEAVAAFTVVALWVTYLLQYGQHRQQVADEYEGRCEST